MAKSRYAIVPMQAALDPDLNHTTIRVLVFLGLHLDANHEAWPKQSTIAQSLNISQSTVTRSLKQLIEKGYVVSRKLHADKPGTHLCYTVYLEPIESKNDTKKAGRLVTDDDSGIVTSDQSGIVTSDQSGIVTQMKIPESSPVTSPIRTNPIELPNRTNPIVPTAVERLWDIAPAVARKRSSKGELTKAMKVALKTADADTIISAYQAWKSDKDNAKDNFKFAPGIHRWVANGRYEAFSNTKPETATNLGDVLDKLFAHLAKTGHWAGGGQGYPIHPSHERAKYDDALYERHGIARSA